MQLAANACLVGRQARITIKEYTFKFVLVSSLKEITFVSEKFNSLIIFLDTDLPVGRQVFID